VTSSLLVRQAIARCVDKNELIQVGLKGTGFALPVHGYYGRGQWITGQVFPANEALGTEELSISNELWKLATPNDLEEAKRLLIVDGWTLNAQGEPYQTGDGIRYRNAGDALEALTIRWAKPENSQITDTLQRMLEKAFAQVGIGLEVTEMSFEQMLIHYFRMTDRTYDMFFLSSNFYYLFEPYYDFNTADIYQGTINVSGLQDETLMNLGLELMQTAAGDMRAYAQRWLAFQARWVEMMPMLPLYSSIYYDLHTVDVKDYTVTEQTSWVQAILYASVEGW
jgi:ABC-type transport system substrate-binding protein